MNSKQWFARGMRAGIPIALGYFAVALALGIAATEAGLNPLAAALTSLLTNASAGEYAGFTGIRNASPFWEVIFMQVVVNIRYLLMSASLSQKLKEGVGMGRRLLLGLTVTDEIFGASISLPERLDPSFTYGCFVVATTGWTGGTLVGAVLGNVLPDRIISALSVGLFGMFISVFVPKARENRVVMGAVLIGFAASAALAFLVPAEIWGKIEGLCVIALTVLISLGAAILFPIREEEGDHA
ncbi:MAG: AzlC family ABC transporter permease [Clostridia bacterium]|nr:AzlC family ABC transporter permease [Clostridia bacterium]